MANRGLEKLMSCTLAGVNKMLIGKKFPMNIRQFQFVILELLLGFVEDMCKYQGLLDFLERISAKS